MTESEIKNAICELLERFPDRCLFTVNLAGRRGYNSRFLRKGWPDITGIWGGYCVATFKNTLWKPLFIEVKKPGGTMSCEQFSVLTKAEEMGAITILAQSVEDVRRALGV